MKIIRASFWVLVVFFTAYCWPAANVMADTATDLPSTSPNAVINQTPQASALAPLAVAPQGT